jgi:hypothetical protein
MSSWYEMVIEGREEDIRDLLPGVASDGDRPFWGEELEMQGGSFPDRIRELLGARAHHLLYVPSTQVGALVRAIEGKPEIRLERVREILSGRFPFKAKAYSPEVAAKIREVLHGQLPPGVTLEEHEEEKVDPDAKGVELYTPVHDYTWRCRGIFSGLPPGIFQMHRTLQALDFVHQEKLDLEGREVEPERLV